MIAFTKPAVDWKAFRNTLESTATVAAGTKYDIGAGSYLRLTRIAPHEVLNLSKTRIGEPMTLARRWRSEENWLEYIRRN